jgi:hypothetical protein
MMNVTLSVDALEWTAHWLGQRRCDLLSVFIATDSAARPQVRIVAVESKGSTEIEPVAVRATAAPLNEAVEQVVATLDALEDVLSLDSEASLFADLKLSAFVEHLATETLAQIAPISAGDAGKLHALNVLTALSRRQYELGSELVLEGLAAVTQRNASVETVRKVVQAPGARRTWRVTLARCGVLYVRQLLELAQFGDSVAAVDVLSLPSLADPAGGPGHGQGGDVEDVDQLQRSGVNDIVLSTASEERLIQLEAACKLRGFRIGEIDPSAAVEGPTLIAVSVELAAGESLRPIQSAAPDIGRELGVPSVVVENDPKRQYHIRFLLPRADRFFPILPEPGADMIRFGAEHYYPLFVGAGVDGQPFVSHVSEWPHLLVAGTTGSGKTTFLKSLLHQLNALPAGELSLVIVDGKGEYDYVDLYRREHFPPKFDDVQLGHEHAVDVLRWLVEEEVARRRSVLREYFGLNPDAPRAPRQAYLNARRHGREFPLSPIVVVVDEFAEIMLASGPSARQFEELVQRVVQAGRSALVHLVLATQRPDANVLPGAIKANMPSRVALALPSHHDSMTVLNSPGAEALLGRGDLILQTSGGDRLRLQGYQLPS